MAESTALTEQLHIEEQTNLQLKTDLDALRTLVQQQHQQQQKQQQQIADEPSFNEKQTRNHQQAKYKSRLKTITGFCETVTKTKELHLGSKPGSWQKAEKLLKRQLAVYDIFDNYFGDDAFYAGQSPHLSGGTKTMNISFSH